MVDIVLHVGGPKCGSSAIQTALTRRPVLKREDGSLVAYGIIENSGKLIRGKQLHGMKSIRGYEVSASAAKIGSFDAGQLAAISQQIDEVSADTLVLSNETWLSHYKQIRRLLPHLGKNIRVIAYVRPPVSFLNAAWWQWGAWQDRSLDEWLAARLHTTLWAIPLSAWRADPHVGELSIRLLQGDIVGDLFKLLGLGSGALEGKIINKSLPGPILRLFQMNRKLRPAAHASHIDFILSKRVNYVGTAPWVLDPERIQRVIRETTPSNHKLLDMLTTDLAEQMRSDRRWWDAEAFADEPVAPWTPQPPDVDDLERLCVAMADAIVRMENQILKLRRSLDPRG